MANKVFRGEVVFLRDPSDIRFFGTLMNRYHRAGARYGFAPARRAVYVVEGFWVAGAALQPPTPFAQLFIKHKLDTKRSYFIRRIAKFAPGDWLVEFLEALSIKLRDEGKELLVTLGYKDHSNALYKLAGFELIGYTRSGKPIFIRRLRA